jgi:hypothetical protein
MQRKASVAVVIALGVLLALAGAAVGSQGPTAAPAGMHGSHRALATVPAALAPFLAEARLATAKYATSIERAKRDGYTVVVTKHIPDMGWHFMNPGYATKFDVTKPAILVYVKRGSRWQLVAFEWVFPAKPGKKPLPGATYGSFGAACHYKDGTFVLAKAETDCARTSPESGAAFGFWHPDLVTLHVWLWYPNPAGIFAGTNPLMRPFNRG